VCSITGVTTLASPPAAGIFGIVAVEWAAVPSPEQLAAAQARVAALAAALEADAAAVAGAGFALYCGCAGDAVVTAPAGSAFAYAPVAGSGLPEARCGARLAATAAIGTTTTAYPDADFGQFCSSPDVVVGGVEGEVGVDEACYGPLGVATGAGGGGSGAVGAPVMEAYVEVAAAGEGYLAAPTFTASPAGASTYTLFMAIDRIDVISGGRGYSSAPDVVLTGALPDDPYNNDDGFLSAEMAIESGTPLPDDPALACEPDVYPVAWVWGPDGEPPFCPPLATARVTARGGVVVDMTEQLCTPLWNTLPVALSLGAGERTGLALADNCGGAPPALPVSLVSLYVYSISSNAVGRFVDGASVSLSGGGSPSEPAVLGPVTLFVSEVVVSNPAALELATFAFEGECVKPAEAAAFLRVVSVAVVAGGSGYSSATTLFTGGCDEGCYWNCSPTVVGGEVVSFGEFNQYSTGRFTSTPAVTATPRPPQPAGEECRLVPDECSAFVGNAACPGCQALAYDTIARLPCSNPPLAEKYNEPVDPADVALGTPGTGTCGVESSFVVEGASGAPAACLLLVAGLDGALPGGPGGNAPYMPITNDNENANANANILTNANNNTAVNNNFQTVASSATGGTSGDSSGRSSSNPSTTVSNPISANVGASAGAGR
jgi:hypothetical protein